MNFNKRVKNLNVVDIGLVKWSAIAFALFVVSVWNGFAQWVLQTPWGWFLALSLTLAVVPAYRFFSRGKLVLV